MVDVSLYGLFLLVAAQKVHINLNASYQSSHRTTYDVNEDVYKMTAIIVFTWPMSLPQQRKDNDLGFDFSKTKSLYNQTLSHYHQVPLPHSNQHQKLFNILSKNVQIKLDKIRH